MTDSPQTGRDKNKTSAMNPEDMVKELTLRQINMAESMERLLRFQRQTLTLKTCQSAEDAFDIMESLLIEIVDFVFVSLQERAKSGSFLPLREIRPDSLALDHSLMEWVIETQEVSILPIAAEINDVRLRSLIFLPFGHNHIMLLWLEQEADGSTREQEALLSVLSREMGSVLKALDYQSSLEKNRVAMSGILESVPMGLFSMDHRGLVKMINGTAEIVLAVRRADTVGRSFEESLPPRLAQLLKRMIAEEIDEEEELILSGLHGEDQYLGVTVTSMQGVDGSQSLGKVVVVRDLQLSHEVRKLRQLDTVKNDFLSLVSHELRTPLTSIMAYAETLVMDGNENVPPEWREYIGVIHDEGQRLSRLIDDVLDLTKMEAGKMSYDFAMHDPNDAIGVAVMSLMPLAEAKGHELDVDLAEDIGDCRIAVDRFTQVVNNIVSNAIKYTDPGGTIRIRTYLSDPLPGNKVATFTMEVADNGVGIAPENLDKVFSKFEMVEAIKHHTSGTGLGMSICKQIVEEGHSGKIWLESRVGKGTTVFVRLPTR